MMARMGSKITAIGTFTIDSWNDELYDDGPDVKLGRVQLTKTFAGDLVGTSSVHMLAVSTPADDFQGAAYVAAEKFTGTLQGREGGFVLVHAASAAHGMKVAVIPGSGFGDLTGITGEIAISKHEDGSHTYTFECELS
jgi:hypothetical protein